MLANQFKSVDNLDGLKNVGDNLPDEFFGCDADVLPLAAKIRGIFNRALKLESKETAP